ncbi:MAG: hypothetical protein ABIR69_09145 [Nitrospiraceae bacterium]
MKTNLIVFSVLQASEVDKYRVKLLHQNGPLAPQTFEICHVTRHAVARSDISFERVSRNLEFLQINAQRLLKFLDRSVELVDPSLSTSWRSGTLARIEVMAAYALRIWSPSFMLVAPTPPPN